MRITNILVEMVAASFFIAPVAFRSGAGPNAEGALAAEKQLAKALLENNANAVSQMLASEWNVTSAHGKKADKAAFISVIEAGQFVRKKLDLSDIKVRIYGNVAVITSVVKTSGIFMGKDFSVPEQETDIMVWRNGQWKCVLTHETEILDK